MAARGGHRRRPRPRRHGRAGPQRAAAARARRRGRARRRVRPRRRAARRCRRRAPARRDRTCSARRYTPHCAAIQPAKLVRGLADAGDRARRDDLRADRGDGDRAARRPHRPRHRAGRRRRPRRPRAYTARLPGTRRALAPVYSLIDRHRAAGRTQCGTEIGLRERETFADYRHLIIYGQRTRRRPAGVRRPRRAVPLRLADRGRRYDRCRRCSTRCSATLVAAVPGAARRAPSPTAGAARWASPATGTPSVGLDRATGLAWAGGYVGDGVSTTNLAGRTLADLITGRRHRADRAALGRAPLPALGARAAALARRQRRAAGDDLGRPRRSAHRHAVAARVRGGRDDGAVTTGVNAHPSCADQQQMVRKRG